MLTSIICPICRTQTFKERGAVNRARSKSSPIYCGRKCAGLARRTGKPKAQRVAEKAEYDRNYRKTSTTLKARRAACHQKTYDPIKAAIVRKNRAPYHAKYFRRPEYRKWKKIYDRSYRAKKNYGEFAECFLLTQDIRAECLSRLTDTEIRRAKGTLGKAQTRKRDYAKLNSNKPEIGSLGNP